MFSADETRTILLYEMGTVSAVLWALVCSNVTDAEEGCGDLVMLCGWSLPYL